MRCARHEEGVLRAGGFTLAAVREDDRATTAARDRSELDGGGEARTAAAVKISSRDRIDQRFVRSSIDLGRGSEAGPVLVEGHPGASRSEGRGESAPLQGAPGGGGTEPLHVHA